MSLQSEFDSGVGGMIVISKRLEVCGLVVALVVSLVAACAAPVSLADKESDTAGKRFEPPPSGLARLYVYQGPCTPSSTSVAGPAIVVDPGTCGANDVFLRKDNQQAQNLGRLGRQNWLSVDVAPGDYDIWCDQGARVKKIALAAGEQTFVSLLRSKESDFLGFKVEFTCQAQAVANQGGMAAIRERQRVKAP